MVMLVGVMVAVAMLLVMAAEVIVRALGGSRRGRESEGRDNKGGGEQGSQHELFPKFWFELSRTNFEREGASES